MAIWTGIYVFRKLKVLKLIKKHILQNYLHNKIVYDTDYNNPIINKLPRNDYLNGSILLTPSLYTYPSKLSKSFIFKLKPFFI